MGMQPPPGGAQRPPQITTEPPSPIRAFIRCQPTGGTNVPKCPQASPRSPSNGTNDTSRVRTMGVPIPCSPSLFVTPPTQQGQPWYLRSPWCLWSPLARSAAVRGCPGLSGAVRSLVQQGQDDSPAATPGVLLKRPSGRRGTRRGGKGSVLLVGGPQGQRVDGGSPGCSTVWGGQRLPPSRKPPVLWAPQMSRC